MLLGDELTQRGDHLCGNGTEDCIESGGFLGGRVAAARDKKDGRERIAAAQDRNDGCAVCSAEGVAQDGHIPLRRDEMLESFSEAGDVDRFKSGSGDQTGACLHEQTIIADVEGRRHRGVDWRCGAILRLKLIVLLGRPVCM